MTRRNREKQCAQLGCVVRARAWGLCVDHYDVLRARADRALALQDAKIIPRLVLGRSRPIAVINPAWSLTRERRAFRAAVRLGLIGPSR